MGFAAWAAFGWAVMGYALLIKRYNILWIVAPFGPFYAYLVYNWARQPNQEIENAYKYLLAKRAATCEYEKNIQRFNANPNRETNEYKSLQEYLRINSLSLYQLEADLVDKISSGEWK